jgi:hypothetical protein
MPNSLANALPKRPIVVRPPPASQLASLGLFALLISMLAGILAWLGPDLVRDSRIRDATTAADGARIEETRCRAWLRLLTFCHMDVAERADGAEAKRTLRYAFVGAAGERPVQLQRSRSDPSFLTTDLGQQTFFSRLITLALFCAIPLVGIRVTAVMQEEARKAERAFAAMSGGPLTPVIVEIERKNLMPPRRRLWAYVYEGEAGKQRAVVEWPSRDRPLFTAADEKRAVALQGDGGGAPLLLDAGLTCLDITEAEREAFYAACRAAFAGPQSSDSG